MPIPWIRSYLEDGNNVTFSIPKHMDRDDLGSIHPAAPTAGSLWTFFREYRSRAEQKEVCVMMTRPLWGALEDPTDPAGVTTTTTTTWDHRNFESLRWKYHFNFTRKARGKSMMDVAALRANNTIFRDRRASSIHRPSSPDCPAEPYTIYSSRHDRQPLPVQHYLGSLEKYLSRTGDVRRDAGVWKRYNEPAGFHRGDGGVNGTDSES